MALGQQHTKSHAYFSHLCLYFVILIASVICRAANGFTNYIISTPISHRNSHHLKMSTDALRPISAGFIGCGTIAYSIASGLANPNHSSHLADKFLSVKSIHVTRRSESRSSKLKESYPDKVTVCETPEEVVKNSEIVFLCVLPQHVDDVLADLKEKGVWKEGVHTLVSLVVRTTQLTFCTFQLQYCRDFNTIHVSHFLFQLTSQQARSKISSKRHPYQRRVFIR